MITALAITCLVLLALVSLCLGMVVRVALEVRRLRTLVDRETPPPPYLVCRRCNGYGLVSISGRHTPCPDCSRGVNPS